jgi:hypothetical protein
MVIPKTRNLTLCIGGSPTTHNSWNKTSNYSPTLTATIHVDGASSPTDTAHAIAGNLRRSGSDLVRNMAPQAQCCCAVKEAVAELTPERSDDRKKRAQRAVARMRFF